jgi:hypothetical protein
MTVHCDLQQRAVLCLLAFVLLSVPNAQAMEGKKAKGEFGIMVGFLGGMTVKFEDKECGVFSGSMETDAGISAGLFFEQKVFGPVFAGVTIDYYKVQNELTEFYGGSPRSLGLALRISGHMQSDNGLWVFRPGVASGVTLLGQIGYVKTSQHVTIKPFIEAVYRASPKVGLIAEIGIFSSVWGGNDCYDIEAGPTTLIRFGVLL